MKLYSYLNIIFIMILSLNFTYANNGIWTYPEDIRAGVFGADEGLSESDRYVFNNQVHFNRDITLENASGFEKGLFVGNEGHMISQFNNRLVLYPNRLGAGSFEIRSHENGREFRPELLIRSSGNVEIFHNLSVLGGNLDMKDGRITGVERLLMEGRIDMQNNSIRNVDELQVRGLGRFLVGTGNGLFIEEFNTGRSTGSGLGPSLQFAGTEPFGIRPYGSGDVIITGVGPSSGRVGIGTVEPVSKLEVVGTTTLSFLIMDGWVDMQGNMISNVGTPTQPQHVATKGYVDSVAGGGASCLGYTGTVHTPSCHNNREMTWPTLEHGQIFTQRIPGTSNNWCIAQCWDGDYITMLSGN